MMRRVSFCNLVVAIASAVIGLTTVCFTAYASDTVDLKVCDDLIVRGPERLRFSSTERQFLCGDSKNPPWAAPSESQIKLFLVSFLQSRGYFLPSFTREGTVLIGDMGTKSRIKSLASDGTPLELDFHRFWVPKRKPLTPGLLDEYQDLVQGRIEHEGYPCPNVEALANATDGSMTIRAEPGPRQKIVRILEEESVELRPKTLRRYYPFEEGDWFDGDLVFIANQRIKAEDILASSYMVSTCDADGAVVQHRGSTGLPRRMTVGFGANTETYFILRSTYRNGRVDENASRFDAILSANYFHQRVEGSFDWYFLKRPSSIHLKPKVAIDRHTEDNLVERATVASALLGAYRDLGDYYVRLYAGPNLNHVITKRDGEDENFARILEAEFSGRVMSHDYEFYRGAPRTGVLVDWRYTTASKRTLSTVAVNTLSVNGEILFNFAKLEPPLLVFGLRGNIASTDASPDAVLPDQYLYYLGGSDNVRGFKRRTIPSGQQGVRSIASAGAEVRLVTVIPYNLQPFAFIDSGKIGDQPFVYKSTVFYSPGLGLRWQSPFGSLRGSIARGLVHPEDGDRAKNFPPRWNALLSFGEEF